ncbi:MAG: hypothetical protein ACE5OS_11665 [Anaerolineae bacterium]
MDVQPVTVEQVVALIQQLPPWDQLRVVRCILPNIEQIIEKSRTTVIPRRSLYGLWQGFTISEADLEKARQEMWGDFADRGF